MQFYEFELSNSILWLSLNDTILTSTTSYKPKQFAKTYCNCMTTRVSFKLLTSNLFFPLFFFSFPLPPFYFYILGFSVKYILVLTSNETNSRVFGDLLKERAIDGRNYLMRFARLRRLSEVCLGVAFSGHEFHNRTLGLRWVYSLYILLTYAALSGFTAIIEG